MKLFNTLTACLLSSFAAFSQTNATDVTVVDCAGNSHNLFTELDAGKIIVIGWTMPCSTCAPPLLDVHNEVLNFAISNPGMVELWINDDFGNTTCATVKNWCIANGISNAFYFSDPALSMNDYGGIGMPKAVVVGCSSHRIYYNVNNNPTGAGVTSGINAAFSDQANGCTLALNEYEESLVSCYPNPLSDKLKVNAEDLTLLKSVQIVTLSGNIISTVDPATFPVTGNSFELDFGQYDNGMYFLLMEYGESVLIKRVEVSR